MKQKEDPKIDHDNESNKSFQVREIGDENNIIQKLTDDNESIKSNINKMNVGEQEKIDEIDSEYKIDNKNFQNESEKINKKDSFTSLINQNENEHEKSNEETVQKDNNDIEDNSNLTQINSSIQHKSLTLVS